jgi:hypothetical protein
MKRDPPLTRHARLAEPARDKKVQDIEAIMLARAITRPVFCNEASLHGWAS